MYFCRCIELWNKFISLKVFALFQNHEGVLHIFKTCTSISRQNLRYDDHFALNEPSPIPTHDTVQVCSS